MSLTGRTLRGYTLRDPLGTGGFGTVYRGWQAAVGREVAVKAIRAELADDPSFVRRFEREAQTIARLEHPHIVPLYDFWREPGGAYLVMRLMRGGSLAAKQGLDRTEFVRILREVADAIDNAHRKGVIHRDIKPSNVLLDEEGRAHLADFGLARDTTRGEDITAGGAGTPGFMSPEQAEGRPITSRSDLFSLGLLVYRMLSGEEPPVHVFRLLPRPQGEAPPVLPALHASLPDAVNHVLRKATAVDPRDRHASARELVEELAAALGAPRPGAVLRPFFESATTVELQNPYKGLRAFEEGDAADFFGREALVERLVRRLAGVPPSNDRGASPTAPGRATSRFLAVVGPSGCGKSSVVKAGLLPALRRGALPGSERWFVLEIVPGCHPLEELELGLRRLAVGESRGIAEELRRDERGLQRATRLALAAERDATGVGAGAELLLVVDQFEELYTMVDDRAEARHFVASLAAAATDPQSPVRVVLTLRADFYDRPLLDPALGALLRGATEVVVPMTAEELGRAIEEPAVRAGLSFEPGLVAEIAGDFGPERGTLPLLQYALTGLFERRRARVLTRAGYRATGGVAGALAARAEEVHAGLDEEGREAARQLFLRLVTPGDGGEGVRRRVRRAEIESLGAPVERVIEPFERSRLLSLDRDPVTRGATVEVAHEALLREWPRLGRWIDAHRADIRLERLLGAAAAEWREAGEDPSFLLAGARLAQFEGIGGVELTTHERAFLAASLERRRRGEEQAEERRQSELEETLRRLRRSRALAAVFVALAVIAAGLAGAALTAQRRAREALAKVEPFKDIAALEEVRGDYAAFFAVPPAVDEVEGRVRALRDKGDRLAARLDGDRAALAGVSAAENPRLHASLSKLVADLEALASGDFPFGARRKTAAVVASVGSEDSRRKWAEARQAIVKSPRYAGMPPLAPQVGLVPLGEDATSGLWEFAHLASGDAPQWRDGHVVAAPEMAVVLVLLPACEFWMGTQDQDPVGRNYVVDGRVFEWPVHAVTLARPFFLAKYELTQRQWHSLLGTEPSWFRKGGGGMVDRDEPLRPVEQASWEDCRDLGAASGLRLPSEAEWEYGARGWTATAYSYGDDPALLADHDWYTVNAKARSHPVGEKKANPFGLYDVHGNLSEWCEDGWSDDYAGAPVDGSAANSSGAFRRPVRGGNYLSTPRSARVSTRDGVAPDFRSRYVGLRPARSLF